MMTQPISPEDALKARPTDSGRVCTVCKAGVAAWPNAMVCHCYEMPWGRTAPPIAMDDEVAGQRVLMLLGAYQDEMSPDAVKAFQELSRDLTRIKDSSR